MLNSLNFFINNALYIYGHQSESRSLAGDPGSQAQAWAGSPIGQILPPPSTRTERRAALSVRAKTLTRTLEDAQPLRGLIQDQQAALWRTYCVRTLALGRWLRDTFARLFQAPPSRRLAQFEANYR